MLSFIFPPLFPNLPPLAHLVNPDGKAIFSYSNILIWLAKRFMALQKFDCKKVLFPNGKYYYPLSFSEIQSWMNHRSTVKTDKII
jgi:hypothetical protein